MINPTREQVAVALFNLISSVPGIKFSSRRPAVWDDAVAKPALYMGNPQEEYRYEHGITSPPTVPIDYDVWLYIASGLDPNVIPDTEMNNLLDAIEAKLQPLPGQTQTLGGIVHSAWMEGVVHRAPGYLDGRGMCLFTIKVLVPQ
jgi:hypothetical protein